MEAASEDPEIEAQFALLRSWKSKAPCSEREGPAEKPPERLTKPRLEAGSILKPSSGASIGGVEANALEQEHRLVVSATQSEDRPPPPQQVLAAFTLLELPVTASVRDVQLQAKKLARRTHPDKVEPNLRRIASRKFQELTSAKAVAIAWLKECLAEEALAEEAEGDSDLDFAPWDEEEELPGEVEEDGTGCRAREVSDEEVENLKATGTGRFAEADGGSDESAEGEDEVAPGTSIRASGGRALIVSTEDSFLKQARSLGRFHTANRDFVCSECLKSKVKKSGDVCSKCQKEEQRLLRSLEH